jgi:apolipoprotein N-acyltransferase
MAGLGALQTLAYVHTWAWPLPLLCIALLGWQAARGGGAAGAWTGWCYGTGWLCAAVWWLFISMHHYGGLPAPLAALAVLLLSAALSLYLALAVGLWAHWRKGHWLREAALFVALWVLAEWARTVLFTGFPWLASGYGQVDSPLAGLAPWVGVAGMGAASAWAGICLALAWRRRSALALLVGALPLMLGLAGPGEHTTDAGRFTALLLQTNVSQDEKFAAERMPQTLAELGAAFRMSQADVIVTPETAVPLLPADLEQLAPGFWAASQAEFTNGKKHALVGVPLGNFDAGFTNSVVGWGGVQAYQYSKAHLVPFGEFIPTGFRWFTEMMNIPLGDFNRGRVGAPPFVMGSQRLAPNICYEDLFGEEIARQFAGPPALDPTAMVNFSNIAWFGNSSAVPQHLNISRLRTLEFQRPMLRATNTGATGHIDHQGKVLQMLAPFTKGELTAHVQGRQGRTPYAVWASQWGHWPVLAFGLLLAAWAAFGGRRQVGS